MPNGYIFLGSGNEDFDYCFTLDHFELAPKEKLEPYIQKDYDRLVNIISRNEKETTDKDFEGWKCIRDPNGEEYSKELSWCYLHCLLCKKVHINNSFRYCWSCEFCVQRLFKEQQKSST